MRILNKTELLGILKHFSGAWTRLKIIEWTRKVSHREKVKVYLLSDKLDNQSEPYLDWVMFQKVYHI